MKMMENKLVERNVEIHVGPKVNCSDNVVVESVEINEKTNIICNCCSKVP